MGKLKPCPFCGEDEDCGVRIILNAYLNGIERYAVMCEACGVETYGYETPKEAIVAWNTRVGDKE